MEQTFSPGVPERIARIEGNLEQMSLRQSRTTEEIDNLRRETDGVRRELNNKVDKWEVRIWFIILLGVMTIQFGILSLWLSRLS